MTTTLGWARRYAELGWHVFPVHRDKTPATPSGWHDASLNPEDFTWGGKGIGIATKPSGLLVLDVDIKKRDDGTVKNGLLWLEAMEAEWDDVPRDVEARTPSGGQHVFFRAPQRGAPIQMVGSNGFPDVDLIGAGYAVVEPSKGLEGEYFWMDSASPFDADPPPTPDWLEGLVDRYTRESPGGSADRGRSRITRRDALAHDEDERALFRAMLEALDPDMLRGPWMRAMMAVHAKTGGSELGFRMFDEWSKQSAKYDPRHIRRDWLSLDPWAQTQPGTLVNMAREAGWDEAAHRRTRLVSKASEGEGGPEWGELLETALADVERALGGASVNTDRPMGGGTMADLLDRDFGDTPWMIEGLLAEDTVFAVAGEPKTSKTWCGIEMARAVLQGDKAFGEFGSRRATKPVFGVFAEDSERSLRNRWRAACTRGISARDLGGRFEYVPMASMDLQDTVSLAVLLATIRFRAPDGISLLYLDPLRDLHQGDENDSKAMSAIGKVLRAFRDLLGCAVIFVHHSHKASQNSKGRRAGQTMRGSSALHGLVDGGLYLSNLENPDPSTFINTCNVELKGVRSAGQFRVRLRVEDDHRGEAIRSEWERLETVPGGTQPHDKYESVREMVLGGSDLPRTFTVHRFSQISGLHKQTASKHLHRIALEGGLSWDGERFHRVT